MLKLEVVCYFSRVALHKIISQVNQIKFLYTLKE